MVVPRPEPILTLAPNEAQVNWPINQPWSVKDPKPAFVADRLTIKAYLAAFGSEDVHALYRDWRGIIMAIGKLLLITRMTKNGRRPAGVAVPGIRSASSAGRRHRQGTGRRQPAAVQWWNRFHAAEH